MPHHHKPTPLVLNAAQIDSIRRNSARAEPNKSAKPSITTKAKHAAQATARIVRAKAQGQRIRVSPEERDRRLSICRACEYWNEGGNVGLGECKHSGCGCTRFKHGLATETCPAGKWN